jgi:hypothetical protein
MKLTRAIACVIGLAGFAAGGALAADATVSASPPAPQNQSFAALDVNRDGLLSFSEAFAHPQLGNAFNTLDSNADGQLSRSEAAGVVR